MAKHSAFTVSRYLLKSFQHCTQRKNLSQFRRQSITAFIPRQAGNEINFINLVEIWMLSVPGTFQISDPTWHPQWLDNVWGMMQHQPDLSFQSKSSWNKSFLTYSIEYILHNWCVMYLIYGIGSVMYSKSYLSLFSAFMLSRPSQSATVPLWPNWFSDKLVKKKKEMSTIFTLTSSKPMKTIVSDDLLEVWDLS